MNRACKQSIATVEMVQLAPPAPQISMLKRWPGGFRKEKTIATKDMARNAPSTLKLGGAGGGRHIHETSLDEIVAWCAFRVWQSFFFQPTVDRT